jgi:hypothetical protein
MTEGQDHTMRVPFNDGSGLLLSSRYADRGMGVIERGVLLRRMWHDEDRGPGDSEDLYLGLCRLSLDPDGGIR